MVVSRNPKYWDAPKPYIDEITFRPIIDETSRINTFCAGQADLMYIGAVTNADSVNKKKCGAINPLVLNGGTDLFFNTTKAPMNNAKLRMGIAKAIDPDAYSATVTNGLIASTKSMFRPDSPFYDAGILQPSFDKAAAQTLFDQAAAELGTDTINIPMTTFQVLNYQNTSQYVAAVLNQFKHIKVDLITEASAAHITNCGNRAYTGICVFGTIFDDPDPTFTSVFTCGAATNYTGYCNPKFDELVNDNHSTLDANQRVKDIKDMQKLFYADVPALFVEQRYSWVFSAPGVQDFQFVNDGLPLLDRFWLKTH
jgi:peptide/nickel transport system substrate-binding protein